MKIYNFNSKKNIDSIVDGYFSLPKFSKFLNLWKKKCFYIQDHNYKELINDERLLKKNYLPRWFFSRNIANFRKFKIT